jgi:hypothetical protein
MLFKSVKEHTFINFYGQHSFVLKKDSDSLELVTLSHNAVEINFYSANEWDDYTKHVEKLEKGEWTEKNYIRNIFEKEIRRE